VLIEARIVEASDTFGKSLGVRLGGVDLPFNAERHRQHGVRSPAPTRATRRRVRQRLPATTFLSLPAVGQNGFSGSDLCRVAVQRRARPIPEPRIVRVRSRWQAKMVSSPRVVTADQTKALIEQGTEFPYQQATSSGATSMAFRRATLKLEVTPQITPEGNIILNLDINKDSVARPRRQRHRNQHQAHPTQVLVENGGTVVIGGIFELNDRDTKPRFRSWATCRASAICSRTAERTATSRKCWCSSRPRCWPTAPPRAERREDRPGAVPSLVLQSRRLARFGQVDGGPQPRAAARRSLSKIPTTRSSSAWAAASASTSPSEGEDPFPDVEQEVLANWRQARPACWPPAAARAARGQPRRVARARPGGLPALDARGPVPPPAARHPAAAAAGGRPAGPLRTLYAERDPLYREAAHFTSKPAGPRCRRWST
jgi:hypothetical protein